MCFACRNPNNRWSWNCRRYILRYNITCSDKLIVIYNCHTLHVNTDFLTQKAKISLNNNTFPHIKWPTDWSRRVTGHPKMASRKKMTRVFSAELWEIQYTSFTLLFESITKMPRVKTYSKTFTGEAGSFLKIIIISKPSLSVWIWQQQQNSYRQWLELHLSPKPLSHG